MKKIKAITPFLFPILIIVLGLIIYKILGYEPNFYTIIINIGLAYMISPRIKKIKKQTGEETQITWLFFKKVINNQV